MKPAVLALVSNIQDMARLQLFLQDFDANGQTVHLFTLTPQDLQAGPLHLLEELIAFLMSQDADLKQVSVISNIKPLLYAWYRTGHEAVAGYCLYVESRVRESGLFGEQTEAIRTLADFTNLKKDPNRPAIQLAFYDYEHVMPLLVRDLPFLALYPEAPAKPAEPDASDALNQLVQHPLYLGLATHMLRVHGQPIELTTVAFLDSLFRETRDQNLVNSLYGMALRAFGKLDETQQQTCVYNLQSLLHLFQPESRIGLLALLYHLTDYQGFVLEMLQDDVWEALPYPAQTTVLWSIKRLLFVGQVRFDQDELALFRRCYSSYVDNLAKTVRLPAPLPVSSRSQNRVLVLTAQFLGMLHGPTRNAVDYSSHLRKLGKDVMIINSADVTNRLFIPFPGGFTGNVHEPLGQLDQIAIGDEVFPFYQSKQPMPNRDDLQAIVDRVHAFNPDFVLAIGDTHATADLCARFTTVVTVPCGAILPVASGGYWAVPRPIRPLDEALIEAAGMPRSDVFSVHYAFLKKEKTDPKSRSDFGIPDDAFVVAVVGNRLNEEVTPDFLQLMEAIVRELPEVLFLLAGTYPSYEQVMEERPLLKRHTRFIGYQDDIQSVFAICNAYLNPLRQGGATSAAEALTEGIPVLTKAFGDVYDQLWLDESCETPEEVIRFLKRCIDEPDYYAGQREQARQIGERVFDTRLMMQEILDFLEKKRSE